MAFGLPIVLTSGLLVQAGQPAEAAPKSSCPASAADEVAALLDARFCGGSVAVEADTSETTTAIALPSGEIQQTVSAAPVRVRKGGRWVPVDLTLLRNVDGTVSPKAATSGLVISGAQATSDSHAVVTAGEGADRVSLGWAGKLGEPVLDGDKATYTEVKPGVDLVVQATRTGAETFFVVKRPAAASEVTDLQLPVTGASVSSFRADAAGNVTLLDAHKKPLATAPEPLMWDARVSADTGEPIDVRPVKSRLGKRAARLAKPKKPVDGAGAQVTLTPDQAFFTDPTTVYPVTIDPQLNPVSTTFDTYVRQNDTADHSGANDLELGIASGAVNRSFVHWDTGKLVGKQITAATVYFWNWWSGSCTASSWDIWSTGAASSDTRWGNQPSWNNKEASSTGTKGGDGCADGWVSVDGKSFFQRAATAGQSRGYMGIRASSESSGDSFKQFRSRNAADSSQVPYAVVSYNSYPVVGARSTNPSTSCVTGSGRPYINSATPALQAVITDAEGSAVKGIYEWYTTAGTKIGGATTGTAASGSTISTTVPSGAFTNGNSYEWRVQGNDGTASGNWSSYCEFTVDTTAPGAVPTVSSSTYPAGANGGNVGVAGTFSFDANGVGDVSAFLYGLDANPPTTAVNATSVGGSATVSITPTTAGSHTLYVRSRDRAGNLSAITSYAFSVDSIVGAVSSPKTGDLSAGKTVLSAAGTASTTGVTYQWRRGETDAWATIPAADVTTVSSGAAVTWPVATTGSGQFPGLTWNLENTVNAAEAGPDALDGPLQVRASFSGGTGGSTVPVTFAFDRNRADAPTEDVGVGGVNLLTGNLAVAAADAAGAGSLGVLRTYNTREATAVDPLFGPGWASGIAVPTAGSYGTLTVTASLVQIGLPSGDTLDFAKKATTSTGAAYAPEIGSESYVLEFVTGGNADAATFKLTDGSGNVTTFGRNTGDPTGVYSPVSSVAVGTGATTAISWEKATVGGTALVRPTRAVAPAADGVDCSTAPLTTRGCKTVAYGYAAATTATASAAGDYAGRVAQLTFTAWDPASSAMKSVVLARYSYDTTGRLAAAWDPRLDWSDSSGAYQQATTYTYNSAGILATVTPPGQQPWQLSYTTVPGDAGSGRLDKVSRSALTAGTAVTSVVYHVPLSGSGAPADMSPASTARWGETSPPVDATAVFPPTQVPDGNQSAGTMPTSWMRATVTYLDGNARSVNTVPPGGHATSTWYDMYGNVTEQLTAGNLVEAVYQAWADPSVNGAAVAASMATISQYSSDGQRLLDVYGPEHGVVLSDNTAVRGRSHTSYQYDQGAPDTGQPYNLVTTQTQSVSYWDSAGNNVDTDGRTTTTKYDWKLRLAVATTTDPAGHPMTETTSYDATTGKVLATTTPGGDGSTAQTRTTLYYVAGTGSGDDNCDNRPEWAGLVCRTAPAAQPDTDPETLTTYLTYTMYGQPAVTTDKNSGGTVRTNTVSYDSAGRALTTVTTAGAAAGAPVATQRLIYDNATGAMTATQQLDASGAVTAQVLRAYDTLGRITSYTDADGNTTTVTYDLASRQQTVDDGKATQTATYNDAGQPAQIVDSQAGTFTASYNEDGNLITEARPDGLTVHNYFDPEGNQTYLEYDRGDTEVYGEQRGLQAQGQQVWQRSTVQNSDASYDSAGRLTAADQTVGAGPCTTRTYAYDDDSNRTSATDFAPGWGGSCQRTTPAYTKNWTYDTADRVTNAGYSYDALGRTTTLPAGDTENPAGGDATMTYYTNDKVSTITQNGRTTAYALDVTGDRFRSWTDNASGTAVTATNHYANDSDSPSWVQESATRYTRTIGGLSAVAGSYDSTTGVIDWQINDLNGNVVALFHGNDTTLDAIHTYNEFGQPTNSADIGTLRYGWTGSDQRAADTPGGLILMGSRLYNPATSRFLQKDAIYQGSCNGYEYVCGDPVNGKDLDGNAATGCLLLSCSTWGVISHVFAVLSNIAGVIPGWLCGPCGAISIAFGVLSAAALAMAKDYTGAIIGLITTLGSAIIGRAASYTIIRRVASQQGVKYLRVAQHSKVLKFVVSHAGRTIENQVTWAFASINSGLSLMEWNT